MTETAMMTPEPQRMRALERANEIRLARAELKRRIADGEISAADVILAPPREAATWGLGELLMSQRRWGGTRCRKFLSQFQITETKAIGALTERQRRVIERRYGLNGSEVATLEQLAGELGVTRERVRQIQAEALEKLRARLRVRGLSRDALL